MGLRHTQRFIAALLALSSLLYCFELSHFVITPDMREAIDQISPDSLKGHLSFIASDLLEGRNTPSPGLEIAAEYIAAQFRRAGLEPGGDNGYFQTAKLLIQEPNLENFELKLADGEQSAEVHGENAVITLDAALDLSAAAILKLDLSDAAGIESLTPEQINGKVVFIEFLGGVMRSGRAAMRKIRDGKPALLLVLDRKGTSQPQGGGQLFDPEGRARAPAPRITVSDEAAIQFFDGLKPGLTKATATVHAAAPKRTAVQLRNVVAILRGSDAALKDSCVLVTAHYDHLGVKPSGEGDRIYNGANDDGSGTVSVIELANALSKLKQHPKRSIVFVTFFGEEEGLFGSRYYARHAAFPIANTVADVNLEQIGRTDSTQGRQVGTASLTGFDYSNVADYFQAAGHATGIKVYKDEHASDLYFAASDNQALADAGVPAHTLTVAFQFPDYHGVGDEWQKIDYDNMAKVDRMVAVALLMLSDSTEAPHWDPNNPNAKAYLKAWNEQHQN